MARIATTAAVGTNCTLDMRLPPVQSAKVSPLNDPSSGQPATEGAANGNDDHAAVEHTGPNSSPKQAPPQSSDSDGANESNESASPNDLNGDSGGDLKPLQGAPHS